MAELVIATRGSKLALAQAQWTARRLEELEPGLRVRLQVIKTRGDKILDVPLAQVGGKGLFVKEIEDALLQGRAHLAVHSMKDMPAQLPPGLVLAGVSPRQDPRDVLVSREGRSLDQLPPGARLGTSSLRRRAQLLAQRPDLDIQSIRGNVQTRLAKLESEGLEGVILAAAGLARLGLRPAGARPLPLESMLPAVGQGILGFETRARDQHTRALVERISDPEAAVAARAERAFLARLEGGCQVPIAGHAVCREGEVLLQGLVADLEGTTLLRAQGRAPRDQAGDLGRRVAGEILERGGRHILAQVYGEEPA